jgi:hypothetical protein
MEFQKIRIGIRTNMFWRHNMKFLVMIIFSFLVSGSLQAANSCDCRIEAERLSPSCGKCCENNNCCTGRDSFVSGCPVTVEKTEDIVPDDINREEANCKKATEQEGKRLVPNPDMAHKFSTPCVPWTWCRDGVKEIEAFYKVIKQCDEKGIEPIKRVGKHLDELKAACYDKDHRYSQGKGQAVYTDINYDCTLACKIDACTQEHLDARNREKEDKLTGAADPVKQVQAVEPAKPEKIKPKTRRINPDSGYDAQHPLGDL